MAGSVKATVSLAWDAAGYAVVPDHCPALDANELERLGNEQPRCYREYPDGSRRACIHWIATVRISNANERVDAGYLLGGTRGFRERTQAQCGVLCLAQRRNRPPGC